MIFFVVKRLAYDDRGSYEAFRGLADMCQMLMLALGVTEWNNMSRSLRLFPEEEAEQCRGSLVGQHRGDGILPLSTLETAFRVPPLSDDAPYMKNGNHAGTVAVYTMYAGAMALLTYETSTMLKGLGPSGL